MSSGGQAVKEGHVICSIYGITRRMVISGIFLERMQCTQKDLDIRLHSPVQKGVAVPRGKQDCGLRDWSKTHFLSFFQENP